MLGCHCVQTKGVIDFDRYCTKLFVGAVADILQLLEPLQTLYRVGCWSCCIYCTVLGVYAHACVCVH